MNVYALHFPVVVVACHSIAHCRGQSHSVTYCEVLSIKLLQRRRSAARIIVSHTCWHVLFLGIWAVQVPFTGGGLALQDRTWHCNCWSKIHMHSSPGSFTLCPAIQLAFLVAVVYGLAFGLFTAGAVQQ